MILKDGPDVLTPPGYEAAQRPSSPENLTTRSGGKVFRCNALLAVTLLVARIIEATNMGLTPEQRTELESLSKPLMQWITDNGHPHMKLIIENESAELVEGIVGIRKQPPKD